MHFNVFNKRFTAKRLLITFLSLLVVFVVSLLIYGYDSMHDPEKVKARLYACGKFGDQHMLIDKQYLLFARVTYQGVNYWGKNIREEHNAKGCDDQIQSIDLKVKWPDMTPSSEGFRLDSENKNDITIALNQRSVWPDELGSKDFFNYMELLKSQSEKSAYATEDDVTEAWLNETKKWNPELKLFVIGVERKKNYEKKVYWQEVKGKGVSLVIECLYFKSGSTHCELRAHQPNYGFNTSYITIDFHSELLPHWQQLNQDAVQLIESFKVAEK